MVLAVALKSEVDERLCMCSSAGRMTSLASVPSTSVRLIYNREESLVMHALEVWEDALGSLIS